MPADANEPRLEVTRDGDRTVVHFINCTSLNEYTADKVGEQFLALADKQSGQHVTLDLAPVEYLTSTILSHLVRLHKRLAAGGGRLSLENVRPAVREVFGVTMLDRVFHIIQPAG
jgi:anti-anti-sigma factor